MFPKKYLYSLSWAAFILVVSVIPGKKLPETDLVGIDKVVHLIIYGLLMFLLLRDFKKHDRISIKYVSLAFLICFLFGLAIEVLQHFIPGRSYSLYDVAANSLGVILGYYSFKLLNKK